VATQLTDEIRYTARLDGRPNAANSHANIYQRRPTRTSGYSPC